MGDTPDHQRLAAEVLGIRGATPELARRLVAQALVVEDRRDAWRQAGERICSDAPPAPGVYILKDAGDRAIYVGKAVNLRRRLRAHFADKSRAHREARYSEARIHRSGDKLFGTFRVTGIDHAGKPFDRYGIDRYELRDGRIALKDSYLKGD